MHASSAWGIRMSDYGVTRIHSTLIPLLSDSQEVCCHFPLAQVSEAALMTEALDLCLSQTRSELQAQEDSPGGHTRVRRRL